MARDSSLRPLVVGATLVLVGLWLRSDPQCGRGCRTVAEHLIKHGFEEFFRGFAT